MKSSAVISDCQRYRYSLLRVWDEALPVVAWVMLNPSTADADNDDPTIRRCMGFARAWGAGGIAVVNLFAIRSTDPSGIYQADDPVGPHNDTTIKVVTEGRRVIAAWGTHGAHRERDWQVMKLLRGRLESLGKTQGGHPRHPLYVRADAQPQPFGLSLAAPPVPPAGAETGGRRE